MSVDGTAPGRSADAPHAAVQASALRRRKGRRRHSRRNGPLQGFAPPGGSADLRGRFDTAIADVATTGNSGSGVFDAAELCLLGVMSRKISIAQQPLKIGAQARTTDIAKYFVPAATIKAFIPQSVSF